MDSCLFGYDVVLVGKQLLMFQRIVVSSSSGSGSPSKTVMPDPKYKGSTILQNPRNYSPNNTASHPRDLNIQDTYQFEVPNVLF
jgi:hypothetical protein